MSGEMRVGACAYCGSGPLTADHKCFQMKIAKEEVMSDIIKRAKRFQDHLRDTNSQEAEELVGELIAEVERLEYAVEAMQDTANKDKVRHREQIESLTKELEEAIGKHGPASGFWGRTCARQQKEIKDLETQLTESKKKVEELEIKLRSAQEQIKMRY